MKPLTTISEEYRRLNAELHAAPRGFGKGGANELENVLRLIDTHRLDSVLDYGAGQGTLKTALEKSRTLLNVLNYDPVTFPEKPQQQFDLVVCTDVLEHVEPKYLKNVLKELHAYTRRICFLKIACTATNKVLSNGKNVHLIQESPTWWLETIQDAHYQGWDVLEFKRQMFKDKPDIAKKVILVLEKTSFP